MTNVGQLTGKGQDALREAIILMMTGSKSESALLKEHYDSLQDLTNISKKTLKRFLKEKAQVGPQTRNLLAAVALGKADELESVNHEQHEYYLDFLSSVNLGQPKTLIEVETPHTTWSFGKALSQKYQMYSDQSGMIQLDCRRHSIDARGNLTGNIHQDVLLEQPLLIRHSQVLLTGEAGMGKTHFALDICSSWAVGNDLETNIPIYIDLKSPLYDRNTLGISSYLFNNYFDTKLDWMVFDFLESKTDQYYFVLDGFDDLTTQNKSTLLNEIYSYSPKALFIILSRPYGFQDFAFPSRSLYHISGFNLEAQEAFVKKALSEFKNNLDHISFMTYIHSHEVLATLAKSPMHLHRLVQLAARIKTFKLLQGINSAIDLQQLYNKYLT